MSKIAKKVVDQVVKMREEGYTQKEVGEKLGIDVRTVRKYDPLYKPAKAASSKPLSLEDQVARLGAAVRLILDWVRVRWQSNEDQCPRCGRYTFEWDDDETAEVCESCDFRMPTEVEVCMECLYIGTMDEDSAVSGIACPQCGSKRKL